MQFETNFGVVALQFLEEDRQRENAPPAAAITPSGWIVVGSGLASTAEGVANAIPGSERKGSRGLRASFSTSHLSNFATNPPVVSGQCLNTPVLLSKCLHVLIEVIIILLHRSLQSMFGDFHQNPSSW